MSLFTVLNCILFLICGFATVTSNPLQDEPLDGCCTAEQNETCLFGGTDVYYSYYVLPDIDVPPHDGDYLWSSNVTAYIGGPDTNITPNLTWTMDYYISTPDVQLVITFHSEYPYSFESTIATLSNYGSWQKWVASCNDCCRFQPNCKAMIYLKPTNTITPFVFAIDNAGLVGSC